MWSLSFPTENRFNPFPHMFIIEEVHIKIPCPSVGYICGAQIYHQKFLSFAFPPFYSTSLLMIKAVLCSFWTANKT
jgi:hypothetical protein